ncbi:hypothetical protein [Acinetobacter colistiniresistens]|uniref:Uncharacterized protein n=1 Tax=Acinetobacter colistiniresistens TaxID=280145 RepID=A0A558EX92_9GAMM|nr:hypothetical protein [Acinetobacter colistiniresistens]TVT77633.1 hypothetical protein FPV60_18550 [Acinetobacter colistiniresistens]
MNKDLKKDQVSNIEWLGKQMRAKTANFEMCTQDTNLEPVTWEDRCGAFAVMDTQQAKALASLYVWGHKDKQAYDLLINFLANIMFTQAQLDGKGEPKNISMRDLSLLIARMVLEFALDEKLESNFTAKGRLYFAGIGEDRMSNDAYRMSWMKYEKEMQLAIYSTRWEVETSIEKYRKRLKKFA